MTPHSPRVLRVSHCKTACVNHEVTHSLSLAHSSCTAIEPAFASLSAVVNVNLPLLWSVLGFRFVRAGMSPCKVACDGYIYRQSRLYANNKRASI